MRTEVWKDFRKQVQRALMAGLSAAIIEQLVALDPTVLEKDPDSESDTESGPLLLYACSFNPPLSIEVVKVLIKLYPPALRLPNKENDVPLMYACSYSSLDHIQLLVDQCPGALRAINNSGLTPLHCACYNCDSLPIRKYLVEHWPVACLLRDRYGRTPWDIDVHNRRPSQIILFMSAVTNCAVYALIHVAVTHLKNPKDTAVVDHVRNTIDHTWLTDFLSNGNIKQHFSRGNIQILLGHQGLQNILKDSIMQDRIFQTIRPTTECPMSLTTEKALSSCLAWLLDCPDLQVMIQTDILRSPIALEMSDDFTGMTPLHVACGHPRPIPFDIIELLVALGPAAVRRADLIRGSLPFHYACAGNAPEVVLLLHMNFPEGVRVLNSKGDLPLHLACQTAPPQTVEFLLKEWPIACLILDSTPVKNSPMDWIKKRTDFTQAIKLVSDATKLALCALIDIALCLKNVLPQMVIAHVAATVPSQFSIETVGKANVTVAPSTPLDSKNLFTLLDNEKLKAVLLNKIYEPVITGFIHMNQAGRNYVLDDPRDKQKAVSVFDSVSLDIHCLFLHLYENPAICLRGNAATSI